jgi:hypothetical protein
MQIWNRKIERRSPVDLALRPDVAAVAADCPLNRRQPDAGSREFFLCV